MSDLIEASDQTVSELKKRYQAGESVASLSRSLGIPAIRVKRDLIAEGVTIERRVGNKSGKVWDPEKGEMVKVKKPPTVTRAYEYKLYPTKEQEKRLFENLRMTRELYNELLEERSQFFHTTGGYLNYYTQKPLHPVTKHPGLHSRLIEGVLERVQKSYARFYDHRKEKNKGLTPELSVGMPGPKAPNEWHSFEYSSHPDSLDEAAGRWKGPGGIGRVKCKVYRPLPGPSKRCRIIRRMSGWYVQLVVTLPEPEKNPASNVDMVEVINSIPKQPATGRMMSSLFPRQPAVGLDLGLKTLVTDTDGVEIPNPEFLLQSLDRLKEEQQKLSRCQKGSARKRKQGQRVARLHETIANQRKEYTHAITRYYADNYQIICLEGLGVQSMMTDTEKKLSRRIADAAFAEIRRKLEYKAVDRSSWVLVPNPQYCTQLCSECGAWAGTTFSDEVHNCKDCHYKTPRRHNSARNALQLAVLDVSVLSSPVDPIELSALYRQHIQSIRAGSLMQPAQLPPTAIS